MTQEPGVNELSSKSLLNDLSKEKHRYFLGPSSLTSVLPSPSRHCHFLDAPRSRPLRRLTCPESPRAVCRPAAPDSCLIRELLEMPIRRSHPGLRCVSTTGAHSIPRSPPLGYLTPARGRGTQGQNTQAKPTRLGVGNGQVSGTMSLSVHASVSPWVSGSAAL